MFSSFKFAAVAALANYQNWNNPDAEPPPSYFPPNINADQKTQLTAAWKSTTASIRRSVVFFGDDHLVSTTMIEDPTALNSTDSAYYKGLVEYWTAVFKHLQKVGVVAASAPPIDMAQLRDAMGSMANEIGEALDSGEDPNNMDPNAIADALVNKLVSVPAVAHVAPPVAPPIAPVAPPIAPVAPRTSPEIDLSGVSLEQLLAAIAKRSK